MRLQRVRPGKRLLRLISLCTVAACLIALAGTVWPSLAEAGAFYGGVLLGVVVLVALLDGWSSRLPPAIAIERLLPGSMALGQWTSVTLRVRHDEQSLAALGLYDHYPPLCRVAGLPAENIALLPGRFTDVVYRLRPLERGLAIFSQVEVRAFSTLGLWELQFALPLHNEVKVYPNFSAVMGYSLLATDNHVGQLGIKRQPRRGEGTEFHQLREYRHGDSIRQLDWKATSRRLQLISREYQDERDQQVVLMLDAGRRMRTHDLELSHFDHALNASLMLAFVALRQGDSVSMMSFGQAHRWVPSVKGGANIHQLLNRFYDLHAGPHASDFVTAAQELVTRQRKRSLIMLLTNLRDEDTDDLLQAIQLLRQRHLVLVANLQEAALAAAEQHPVETFDDALRYGGVVQYQQLRYKMQERLQSEGVLVLDCSPSELSVRLINRYLEVKRANLL